MPDDSESTPGEESPRPAWLNAASIAGLCLFIGGGVILLKNLSGGDRDDDLVSGLGTIPGETITDEPSLIRPGENGRPPMIALSNPDFEDTEKFRQLAKRDPLAAAGVVSRLSDTPTRDERLYDLMQIWAEKDPAQAAHWVMGLPVSAIRDDATAELGLAWGHLDPEAAASWVEENIFTKNAPAGATSLTSAWVKQDIDAASKWVAGLDPDTPARKGAMTALAYHLGELDPQRGLAWMRRLSAEDRDLVVVNFVATWSNDDPEAAANWIRFQAKEIDSKVSDQAALTVIHSWTDIDPGETSNWIDKLEDGDLKEAAKATFAESHAEASPIEALPWAQSIRDPERRLETTMNVLEEWVINDRDSFKVEMRSRWQSFDRELHHEVYDLLLDHDPEFKKELFEMLDEE